MMSVFDTQAMTLAPQLLPLGFISGFGYMEMFLFGVIALMLFGSRLPEVARNFGRTYRQLRSKVDDFQREFREWERDDTPPNPVPKISSRDEEDERVEPKAPKFLPPPAEDEDNE